METTDFEHQDDLADGTEKHDDDEPFFGGLGYDEVQSLSREEFDELRKQVQQRRRQGEWGKQFDVWLISAASKKRVIEVTLSYPIPSITRHENTFTCTPRRIDRFFVLLIVDQIEVWVNKKHIISCRPAVKSWQGGASR